MTVFPSWTLRDGLLADKSVTGNQSMLVVTPFINSTACGVLESVSDANSLQKFPEVSHKLKTSNFLALKMGHSLEFGPDGAQNSRQLHSHSVLSES